jgi:hypothetical protein
MTKNELYKNIEYSMSFKNRSYGKTLAKRAVENICLSEEVSEKEKIELLKDIQAAFGASRGEFLTRSLFNLLLMEKNGVIAIASKSKIASYENLILNGLAFTTYQEIETSATDLLPTTVSLRVLRLTPYGLQVKKELLEQGENYIIKQIEIFQKLGY